MKNILVFLSFIIVSIQADFMCASAGANVEQYSREYDNTLEEYNNAVDAYESAEKEEKEDLFNAAEEAKNNMQYSKSNLENAVSEVFQNCESRELVIIGDLLEEKKRLQKENEELSTTVEILKLQKIYPTFDPIKVKKYLQKYQSKYGDEATDKLNNPIGWEKIWVKNFEKKNNGT